jgi:hypothetical protein
MDLISFVCLGTVLSVLSLEPVLAQDPTVRIMRTSPPSADNSPLVTGIKDQDLTMDCFVENLLETGAVRWQRLHRVGNMLLTQPISLDMALDNNIDFSIEKPTQFTWRLRVRTIQVSDEGVYMCFVQVTLNSRVSANRTVVVVFAPYLDLTMTSPDTIIQAGESLDLVCNATAKPAPLIEWSRLGGSLLPIGQEKYKGTTLRLTSIQAGDRGIYRCVVMNSVGTVTHDVNLGVLFQPVVYIPRATVYQAVGYRVELQCEADANPSPSAGSQVAWVKGSSTISQSSSNYNVKFLQGAFNRLSYELIIYSVRQQDFGTYSCRVTNTYGTSSASLTLTQTNTPQPSVKLGRVVPGTERIGSAAPPLGTTLLLSVCAMLLVLLVAH